MRGAARGPASRCGSTRASCAAATRGMRRSASRSRSARCSCRSSRRTRRRGGKATSGCEWKLAVERSHADMADDQAFLLPVVIDDDGRREARAGEIPRGAVDAAACQARRRRPSPSAFLSCCSGGAAPSPVASRRAPCGGARRGRRPTTCLDRRAAVHQHEPRRGERVLRRRLVGRIAERPGEDPRAARRVAHVGVLLQGQGRRHPDGGAEAQRGHGARRQRPQVRQARAHHRAAH